MRKLIGKGSFTRAYQTGENTVEVVSTCPAKECYAMFSQDNPFAPKIERDYTKENTFQMPLYPKVKAPKQQLNPRAYTVYHELRKLNCYCSGLYDFRKGIERNSILTKEEKENIISLAEDVCNAINPSDLRFEISPRNITFDAKGDLIMLDCFFCRRALVASWAIV